MRRAIKALKPRRTIAMLLAVITIFTLLATALIIPSSAAEGPEGIKKADGSYLTEEEMKQLLEEAYQSVSNYGFSLLGTSNPYSPTPDNPRFCCATFVTYVYTYYIGGVHGYLSVPDNEGIIPQVPADRQIQPKRWEAGKILRNAAHVGAWLEFVNASPKWPNATSCEGMSLEDIEAELTPGSILFFARNGFKSLATASDSGSHIGIYAGDGWMYHCTSGVGVQKIRLADRFDKAGVSNRLVGYTLVEYPKGQIVIKKTDDAGTPLAGAVFEIRDANGNLVDAITTSESGIGFKGGLPLGDYTVIEIEAPSGYGPKDGQDTWDITISEDENVITLEIINTPEDLTKIPVTKMWSDRNNASGTRPDEITLILLDDGREVKRVTIGPDREGTTVSGSRWLYTFEGLDPQKVKDGKYTIEELEADQNGYKTTIDGFTITNTSEDTPDNPGPSGPGGGPDDEYIDNRTPPVFQMPSFTVSAEKTDLEGGFDNDRKTPRGDATLAAGYRITWSGTGGVSGGTTISSNEFGSAQSYTFSPWSSVGQLTRTEYKSKGVCGFADVVYAVEYQGSVRVRIEEIVPEGYLSETNTGTGSNYREYTFNYTMRGDADAKCTETTRTEPPASEDEEPRIITIHALTTDWTYKYSYGGSSHTGTGAASDTGASTQSTAHAGQSIGHVNFINRVQKGVYQLVKTYDKDLDPWTITVGQKEYINASAWTLRLLDSAPDGNGGLENHPYVNVVPINKGEANYYVYANSYNVTADSSGTPADADNPLITSEYGQINLYGLPYGKYVLQEIKSAPTDGYVLETIYIDVTSKGIYGNDFETEGAPPISNEANDFVISNTITVIKKDSVTGKTVPMAGTAFRIRYMGNPNTANNGGDVTQDPNYGRYIKNGASIDDGYQYVFYTDATGKITLPYELEYGIYQLEEITAPHGYYIGRYDESGTGAPADGKLDYLNTVAIFDAEGNRIDYTADPYIVYNYYQFSVTEQDYEDSDGDGLPDEGGVRNTIVQIVDMTDNSVHGMIEITKYADTLVGFTESESGHGTINIPVYEMRPLEGAEFEIVAAVDETLGDGYEPPELIDGDGNVIPTTLEQFNHLLWPDAVSTYHGKAPDGTDAYITTTRNHAPDGTLGEENRSNTITATLLTALQKGPSYNLVYEVYTDAADSSVGVGYTTLYDITIGMEYAAGGWSYSYVEVKGTITLDDYNYATPDSEQPVLKYGGEAAPLADALFDDGSGIELKELTDKSETEIGKSLTLIEPRQYISVPCTDDGEAPSDVPDGYTAEDVEVYTYEVADTYLDMDFTGTVYALDGGRLFYMTDLESWENIWIESRNISFNGTVWYEKLTGAEIPEGYELATLDMSAYAVINAAGNVKMLAEEKATDKTLWVIADDDYQTYRTREFHALFDLNEAPDSNRGFSMEYGGFKFSSISDSETQSSTAVLFNSSDSTPTISESAGCTIEESEDGSTHTITVKQPVEGTFYVLGDGTKVGVTYLGKYTRTVILVPSENELPVIKYLDASIGEYTKDIDPLTPEQTTDLGGGNYVKAVFDQYEDLYTIEIVSSQTGRDGFEVEYYDGSTGSAFYIQDPETGAYRGELDIVRVSKTLVYASGKVVETVRTDKNGIAYSSLLPLGTYYVREVSAPYTYVSSANTVQVDLDYAGQYVPLVWGSATVENESAKVTIDIKKSFQVALGSDEYEPRPGAVFGVYSANPIAAKAEAKNPEAIDKDSVTKDELMSLIVIGNDGLATVTLTLPFANNYYVRELESLPGYTVPDTTYPFRVDEESMTEPLKLADAATGVLGTVYQSDLFETTIKINTLYQYPPIEMTVNGEVLSSDEAFEGDAGAAFVTNEVFKDKTTTTIIAKGTTVIEFANGDVLTVTVKSDGYIANLRKNSEAPFAVDTGAVGTTTITEEAQPDGSVTYTYEPKVSYTGYAVDLTAKYNKPEFVMNTKHGVNVTLFFDGAASDRLLVLKYPQGIELPEYNEDEDSEDYAPKPEYVTVDDKAGAVIINLDELALQGGFDNTEAGFDNGCVYFDTTSGDMAERLMLYASGDSFLAGIPGTCNRYGNLGSGLSISAGGDYSLISHKTEQYAVTSENGLAKLTADLNPNYSNALLTLTGTAISAKDGLDNIDMSTPYVLSPGHTVTVITSDEAVFAASLDRAGVLTLHVEGIVNGLLATGDKAPYAERGGSPDNLLDAGGSQINQTFPSSTVTCDGGTLSLSQTLTYSRATSFVKSIAVKINSTSENHMTGTVNGDGRPGGVENDILNVVIYKMDAVNGAPLSGAVIAVYDADTGSEIFRGRSGADGKMVWSPARAGEFYYTEISAPSGYSRDTQKHYFTVNANGLVTGENTLYNTPGDTTIPVIPTPKVTFNKTNAITGIDVPGAELTFWDANGNIIYRGMTDARGRVQFDMPAPGVYTFQETAAPKGYYRNPNTFTFEITADRRFTGDSSITDAPVIPVVISKTDVSDGSPVKGAEITIWNSGGEVIFQSLTDEDGRVTFEPPAPGVYTFRETVAPDGYYINTEVFTFTVNDDGSITGATGITDVHKIPVVINKTDVSDGSPVKDAEITIWNSDGEEVFRSLTDENGQVTFEPPAPGVYTFRETVAPAGYILNEETFTFTVNADGTITGATEITNKRVPPVPDIPQTGASGLSTWLTVIIILAASPLACMAAVYGYRCYKLRREGNPTDNSNKN